MSKTIEDFYFTTEGKDLMLNFWLLESYMEQNNSTYNYAFSYWAQ